MQIDLDEKSRQVWEKNAQRGRALLVQLQAHMA